MTFYVTVGRAFECVGWLTIEMYFDMWPPAGSDDIWELADERLALVA